MPYLADTFNKEDEFKPLDSDAIIEDNLKVAARQMERWRDLATALVLIREMDWFQREATPVLKLSFATEIKELVEDIGRIESRIAKNLQRYAATSKD